GRFITGFDEESWELNMINDLEERARIAKERKELRESLEKALGNDLSGTSTFCETFGVKISSDQELTLNRSNPLDVVKYHMLIANGYVAPNKALAAHPDYLQAKYYCHVDN